MHHLLSFRPIDLTIIDNFKICTNIHPFKVIKLSKKSQKLTIEDFFFFLAFTTLGSLTGNKQMPQEQLTELLFLTFIFVKFLDLAFSVIFRLKTVQKGDKEL